MARNKLANCPPYFIGQEKQLGKKISFFRKEQDLKDWIRESPHRHQIAQTKAKHLLGDDYSHILKTTIDKDIVEPDPEYQKLLDNLQVKLKKSVFNPYRHYDVNYMGNY